MADFLSTEWIAELDSAAQADTALRDSTAGVSLVLQQTVTDTPNGDIAWNVVVDDGTMRITPGTAEHPDVTFTQNYETAKAVATSEMSAQAAFMLGRLRVGGTVAKLIEHREAFDGLDDLFTDIRARTQY